MTPFRNDEENPFARERVWPAMPQAPLRLARARTVLGMGMGVADAEPEPAASAAAAAPFAAAPRVSARRRRRLAPLIGAAAVGVGGLLTLFLVIGLGPSQP
ncbi:MAG: hypothetical protein ACXU8S_03195 [Phenylobacterium sp.]